MHIIVTITLLLDRICHYLDFNKIHLLNFRQVCWDVNDFINSYYPHITLSEWELSALLIDRNGESNCEINPVHPFPIFCERKGVKIYLSKTAKGSFNLVFKTFFKQTKRVLVRPLKVSLAKNSGGSTFVFNKNFTLDGSSRNLLCLYQISYYDSDGFLDQCDVIDYTNILYPIIYNNIQLESEVVFWGKPLNFERILFDSFSFFGVC